MNLRQALMVKAGAAALFTAVAVSAPASAEVEPYIGQMTMVGQPWCPRGWAPLNGQLLAISSNEALFSLIGCEYGGDCRTSFALPDMRGRSPVGIAPSPNYQLGVRAGQETATMTVLTMPAHSHRINAADRPGTSPNPAGRDIADFTGTMLNGYTTSAPDGQVMAGNTIGMAGGSQPFEIRQPYQVINYCIATVGLYPPRN